MSILAISGPLRKNSSHKMKRAFLAFILLCAGFLSAKSQDTTAFTTLVDSIWVFSQTHPDGFTLSVSTWEEPQEGIAVAYSSTLGSHDKSELHYVVSHALDNAGYVGGWLDTDTAQLEEALAGEEEKSWNKLQLRWEEGEDGKASEA